MYYTPLRSTPKDTASAHFFNIDNDLVYWNFFLDFGPLNLGQFYRFSNLLNSKLQSDRFKVSGGVRGEGGRTGGVWGAPGCALCSPYVIIFFFVIDDD